MNSHLLDKESYRLDELQAYWHICRGDLRYLLTEGILAAHAWLPLMSVFKTAEYCEGSLRRETMELCHWEGYISISRHSCYRLFRNEHIHLREFFGAKHREHYFLPDTANDFSITLRDLFILRDERIRFEKTHKIAKSYSEQANDRGFSVGHFDLTFKTVHYAGRDYIFGDMQSAILRQLHQAAQTDEPWCSGKRLLAEAGSKSFSLSNLFKRNPIWRKIILSDGRGAYKMNDEFLTPKIV